MGNQCCGPSRCCDIRECCPCCFDKKKNMPPKAEPVDRPKPVIPTDTDHTDYLAIKDWNFELKRNGESHNTSEYHQMRLQESQPTAAGEHSSTGDLIVRRGQAFYLTLTTNIPYDREKHNISLIFFVVGTTPNFGNKTQVCAKVGAEDEFNGWWAKVHDHSETSTTLEVKTSATAIVGEWKLEVDVGSDKKIHCFQAPKKVFLLFNAWCSDDAVYLAGDDERREYVQSDTGLIWRGTHSRLRPCPWQFGQYEKDVLEAVLYVLTELCRLLPAHRADPVLVVRAISAGVNDPDDNGVLVGNWSGKYDGGTAPTEWRGSTDILQQFSKKKKPVKYGQCWVFSGVVTSACRAIGIPCRPVTNFSSAHDTHNSLTIDYFCGDDGKPIEDLKADSIWNFHVWNEVWMTRPDLGPDYNGWQVIDATPQEESDGQYRCGPTSLTAIKRGDIFSPYDVPFVYAEVNADVLYWKYQGDKQPLKLLGRKSEGVGLTISTKAVGKMQREDITDLYKHKEESTAEREVMKAALRRCENAFARYYLNEAFEDIKFELQLNDDIVIGEPFSVSATIENKGSVEHEVSLVLRADTMLYTGAIKECVKKHESVVTMKPHFTKNVKVDVTFDEYYKKLVDQCAFNISCLGKVKNTDFEYYAQDDFRVRKPDIEIKCNSDNIYVGQASKWTASFKNPIPFALTKSRFRVLPSCADSSSHTLKKNIGIDEDASLDFEVTPRRAGEMTISVIFSSKELEDVDGFVTREVTEGGKEQKEPDKPSSEEDTKKAEESDEKEIEGKPSSEG